MTDCRVKMKHAHTLTQREREILTAKPTVELDQGKIKWRKVKKWRLTRSKKELK